MRTLSFAVNDVFSGSSDELASGEGGGESRRRGAYDLNPREESGDSLTVVKLLFVGRIGGLLSRGSSIRKKGRRGIVARRMAVSVEVSTVAQRAPKFFFSDYSGLG